MIGFMSDINNLSPCTPLAVVSLSPQHHNTIFITQLQYPSKGLVARALLIPTNTQKHKALEYSNHLNHHLGWIHCPHTSGWEGGGEKGQETAASHPTLGHLSLTTIALYELLQTLATSPSLTLDSSIFHLPVRKSYRLLGFVLVRLQRTPKHCPESPGHHLFPSFPENGAWAFMGGSCDLGCP